MHQNVLKLTLSLKFDIEEHVADLKRVKSALARPATPGGHGRRSVAYIIRTHETPQELMDRLRSALETDRFVNVHCETASPDMISRDGDIDPLVTRIREAYLKLRKLSQPKNMRNRQSRELRVERPVKNLKSGAPVQVIRKVSRKGKPPQDSNGHKG